MNTTESMNSTDRTRPLTIAAVLVGVAWTLFINGAVPGFGTPTIGQAATMLGYAQAFADQHWYAIHARSFGYPVPAALATGLPLAWLAGWFLRIGVGSADAYAAAAAFWLLTGFFGAWRLACSFGARPWLAALAAAAWMGMPMVWGHQGYSSLALGMAMLPLYFWSASTLFGPVDCSCFRRRVAAAVVFVGLCVIALLMDGYTFMMFAIAATLLFAFKFARSPSRYREAAFAAPVYIAGFGGAYLLYAWFVGRSAFDPAPLDFFRGWAVDLTFLAKPTGGELWVWDLMGWARDRSETEFYGDASVWTTTFVLPLALLGLGCFISLCRRDWRSWLLLAVAAFGMYMALGPTLKFHATKPPGTTEMGMPANVGIMPTGNSLITGHVPGFRNMRAAYRWEALFVLGMWGMVALRVGRTRTSRGAWGWAAGYMVLILTSAPHPSMQWGDYQTFRRDFGTIDRDVAVPMATRLTPGSLVLFLPFTNDILVNYLAPRLHVITYNVSGDKQLDIARAQWPERIARFGMGHFDDSDAPAVRGVLLEHDADAVVIPFFNGLNAAHVWPCPAEASGYSPYKLSLVTPIRDFYCPGQLRTIYAPAIAALRADPLLVVDEQPLFAVVTLRPEYVGRAGHERALARLLAGVSFPLDIVADPDGADRVLRQGWYGREPATRWSGARADLVIPVPAACQNADCVAHLRLAAFAASAQRPIPVSISLIDGSVASVAVSEVLTDEQVHVISFPLPKGRAVASVRLDVPRAASPATLGMSADGRVLGVALSSVDVTLH